MPPRGAAPGSGDFAPCTAAHRRHRGGPWHAGPGHFGAGRRAGRGDIRAAILALLAEAPKHGYQIIREIAERSEGAWTPSPGSVYPTLQQLTDEGLVRSDETEGKRVYELTEEGRTSAADRAPAPCRGSRPPRTPTTISSGSASWPSV